MPRNKNRIKAPEKLSNNLGGIKNIRVYYNNSLGRIFVNYDNPNSRDVGTEADQENYEFDNKVHVIVDECNNDRMTEKFVADLDSTYRVPEEVKNLLGQMDSIALNSSKFRYK